MPPELAARTSKIALLAAILVPVIVVLGALRDRPPATGFQWFGSVMVVLLLGLYPEPALYLTLWYKLKVPSALALLIAFSGLFALAWFWIVRWII